MRWSTFTQNCAGSRFESYSFTFFSIDISFHYYTLYLFSLYYFCCEIIYIRQRIFCSITEYGACDKNVEK